MIIIIGLFGFISALALFIEAIMLMAAGSIWLGIGILLSVLYIISLTVVLIKVDGMSTENRNRISVLENQLKNLKKQLNIEDEIPEEAEREEVPETVENSLPEGVRICKVCGYPLDPEDKACPMCNEKVED